MKKALAVLALILVLPISAMAFMGGNPSLVVPAVTAVQANVGTLTFNEEFNDGDCPIPCAASPTKYSRWKTNFYFGNQTNTIAGLSSRYYPNPESVMLDNAFVSATGGDPVTIPSVTSGVASITGQLMTPTNFGLYGIGGTRPYSSAVMTTQNSFAQKYGYFEVKVTLPNQTGSSSCPTVVPAQCLNSVPGTWPAFWMLPQQVTAQNGGVVPEIDVFEHWAGQWVISATAVHANASLSWSAGTVTATTAAPHGINIGDSFKVNITSAAPSAYNVSAVTALSTGASTFTYPLVSNPGANTAAGNYVDISIVSQVWSGGVVTVTTSAPHGKTISSTFNVVIAGATPSGYNSAPLVGVAATATGAYTFTYPLAADPGANTVGGTYGFGVMIDRVARPITSLHWTLSDYLHPQTTISNASLAATLPRQDLTVPHVFGVYWSPTEISVYIDQTLSFSITNPTALATVNMPMYILLSMDVAYYSSGAGDPSTGVYPATYQIDYVRAWTLR